MDRTVVITFLQLVLLLWLCGAHPTNRKKSATPDKFKEMVEHTKDDMITDTAINQVTNQLHGQFGSKLEQIMQMVTNLDTKEKKEKSKITETKSNKNEDIHSEDVKSKPIKVQDSKTNKNQVKDTKDKKTKTNVMDEMKNSKQSSSLDRVIDLLKLKSSELMQSLSPDSGKGKSKWAELAKVGGDQDSKSNEKQAEVYKETTTALENIMGLEGNNSIGKIIDVLKGKSNTVMKKFLHKDSEISKGMKKTISQSEKSELKKLITKMGLSKLNEGNAKQDGKKGEATTAVEQMLGLQGNNSIHKMVDSIKDRSKEMEFMTKLWMEKGIPLGYGDTSFTNSKVFAQLMMKKANEQFDDIQKHDLSDPNTINKLTGYQQQADLMLKQLSNAMSLMNEKPKMPTV